MYKKPSVVTDTWSHPTILCFPVPNRFVPPRSEHTHKVITTIPEEAVRSWSFFLKRVQPVAPDRKQPRMA